MHVALLENPARIGSIRCAAVRFSALRSRERRRFALRRIPALCGSGRPLRAYVFPQIKAAHPGKNFCRSAFHARAKRLSAAALRAGKDHRQRDPAARPGSETRQRDPAAHPAYRTRRKRLNSLYAPAQFDILRLKRDRRPPPLRACAKTCDRRSRSALRAAWHIGRALGNSAAHRCFPLTEKRPRHACRAQTKTAAPGLRASELDII